MLVTLHYEGELFIRIWYKFKIGIKFVRINNPAEKMVGHVLTEWMEEKFFVLWEGPI